MDDYGIEAIPVPALVISDQDSVAACNGAFRALFPHAQAGRSYLTVLRHANLVRLVESTRGGTPAGAEELTLRGRARGVFNATGAKLPSGDVLVCLQDVSETAKAIETRRNFVTDLSHELKSPMTAITGILETCTEDPDAVAPFLPVLSGEVARMNALVADLLTLSRVEANERRAPDAQIVLQTVITEACTPLAVVAKRAQVRIETSLPDRPLCVRANAGEMFRAITNLVENAVRYSEAGGVVTVACAPVSGSAGGAGPWAQVRVSDTGGGVEAHHIPRLTERFYRVDDHRSRGSGGSGLGLAIVKHIVTRHRGRMTFESAPGEGSQVTLLLPME
ncbi:ATP-binding protein [Thalassorhabdomicrobium marinisediminis]|uniref:histidine kinase n=1 Tax=Thalassorhabdomicrobium marinisediminis TaxID=2170577 RepID=A0A2T7FT79_9RHOB|nr:ATP-binding protein [Thalassorhabdomicrobium marinisediminis]PVA05374.1 two-component sensor histidine kinase [Thalassorhabdomicrobium marinisediminis]